ncbi:uncharacterized protein L969DRAFT_477012 [Mixia osmundae IAM 14324]|uniref:Uncharacterized protein n=1 Tax=Mixia osmundae (strain CBS 9802 / IAM 14324 / JCM 22182 / KY 12970) TaxID=764103 RepID=G7E236_MIXOS|nr:uncharacterized protein L969DRAFT_477012 [Mixia osmundae IAM 14324]KEI38669.1 hypothetical protein L969DRAFT_477012 [Mixia osmundae IAM 14324]GAA96873.1 hypothetical protein E5Q_03546 [Mixia osmundae IAM 14324]
MLGLLYLTSFVASLAGVEIQAAPIWSLRHRGWTLTPSFEVSCDEVGQIWTVEHRMIQFETDEEDPGSYTLVHKPIPGETHYFGHQIMQSDARIGFEGYVVPVKIWIDEVIDHHALASDLEQELYEVCCRIRVEFLIDIDLATGRTCSTSRMITHMNSRRYRATQHNSSSHMSRQ